MRKTLQILSFLTTILLINCQIGHTQCTDITPDGPFCEGELVTFGHADCSGTKNWTYDDGANSGSGTGNTFDVTIPFNPGADLTISVTDNSGMAYSESFTVNPIPVLTTEVSYNLGATWTAASIADACVGFPEVRFRGSPYAGNNGYNWMGPNGVNEDTRRLDLENVTSAMDGLYTITYTDGNSCSNTATVDFTVHDLPASNASNNGPVCIGESVTLNETGSEAIGWSWTGPSGANFNNSSSQNPIVSPALAGDYTVVVTDVNGCTSSSTTTVVLDPAPASNATNNGPVCIGESVTLNEIGGDASSWSWTGPSGANFNNSSFQSPIVSPALAGDYTVVVTDDNGCTSSSTTTVVLDPAPASNATNDGPVCIGESVTFNETGGDASSWSWTGPSGANFNNSSLESPTVSPALAGDYTVVVTDNNGCTSSSTTTVVINPLPASNATNDGPVCIGESVTLNETGGDASSWSWTGPSGANFNNTSSQSPIVSPALAGDYTVVVTDGNNCTSSSTTTVVINSLPASNATNAGPVCMGESVTLNETGGEATGWSWTGPSGANFNNTSSQNPIVSPALAGDYTVVVTDGNNCTSSSTTTVVINPLPASNATNAGPVCMGESVTLDETGGDASSWSWTGPNGANFNNSSSQSPIVSPALAGDYTVVVTDGNNCTSSSTTTVVINPLPNATITGDAEVCEDDPDLTITLNATAGTGPFIYTYDLNGSQISTSPTGNSFNITQTTTVPDVYTYTLVSIEDGNGCIQMLSSSVVVNVKPNPILTLNGNLDCSLDLLTYSLDFISDGTVSSNFGTVDNTANTVTGIPVLESVTLTAILNDCVTTLFIPAPNCTCPQDIELPEDTTPADDLEICFGDNNSTLTVSVAESNYSANWYLNQESGGTPLPGSPSLSYTPPASINAPDNYLYYVETIDVNNDCKSITRTPIIFVIHELPTPQITPDNPTICPNASVILDAGDYESYLWNDNSTNQTIQVALPATYSVEVTDENGCKGTDDVFVDQHTPPTVSFPTNDFIVEYCENSPLPTIEFELAPGNGSIIAAQYTFNNGAPINGAVSGNTLSIPNAAAGQYKVVFLEDEECSTASDFESATIIVAELPEPVFTIQKSPTNNSLVCEGDDFTLTPSLTGNQYDYSWEYPGGTATSASISFFDVDASLSGTYTCTITDTSSGEMCTSVSSRVIEVSVVEGELTTNDNGNTEICLGESITLIADGVDGQVTWQNDIPPGQENDFTVEVSPTTTTTYNAILENSDECTRNESITITVNSLPNPMLVSDDTEYCDDEEAVLSTTQDFGQIDWSDGETGQFNTVEANLFDTQYEVTVTNNNGCTATASIDLTVFSNPAVGISTPAQNIPAGEEALFEFKDPETDPACGVQFYSWTVVGVGNGVNESGSTTEEFFNFTFDENGIYEVCVVLVDNCNMCMSEPSCLIMDIDDNTSCKVNFSPQGNNCVGECSTLVANPIPGTNSGANIPELGVFIIEGIVIDASYPLGLVDEGDNGLPFEIKEKWSTDEEEFIDSILVIFHAPGQYNFSFELDYGNCEKTVGPVAAFVQSVPEFTDILIDDSICFGEEARIDFIVPDGANDFVLTYTINDGMEDTKSFSGSDDILFATPATLPASLNVELVDLVNLINNEPVGCFNTDLMPSEFTIDFLEEITYTVIDSCNEDLTEVQYFIELEGGTGDYSIEGEDVDGNEYETEFFPSGQSQTLTLVDEGCDEENSDIISLSSSCETCTPLDDLVEDQNIIVDGNQNVCENDLVTFTMDKMPEISPTQIVVYTVQRTSSQFYDEDNIIIDSIPSDPTVFQFDINSADFVLNEIYYISAYVFSEVATGFKPDEECEGIVARTLTFYSSPVAEIVNLEDDANICINEFDFQVGLDNGVTSSTFTSSDPDNVNISYIEGATRALIDVGAVTDETITITLNQTINHTTTEGILECSGQDDLVLNVLDKVAPSKDTIIGFPGNLFTFVADGFCYQWGLNDNELAGETERFYIADGPLTADDILWINVWDCSDTALECVSTIYFNAFEPPEVEIDPNKALEYNLYPNPNDGIFTLELDGPQVGVFNANLFNATGQLIKGIQFEKEDIIHNQVISLEEAATGLYLLQVLSSDGDVQLIKIIKQ